MIKIYNESEIGKIRIACQYAADCLDLLISSIRPGMATIELDIMARDFLKRNGVEPAFLGYRGYPAAVCVSINEEIVHGIPSPERIIREGDLVSIDVGTKINGYYGDNAATVAVGEISADKKKLLEVGRKALDKAIEKSVENNRLFDVSYAIQKIAEENGFSVVRDFVGHGIGEHLHEEPQVPNFGNPGEGPILKEGMVIAIEPMINMGTYKVDVLADDWTAVTADGMPSVHFEHTVVIRKNKGEVLTCPRKNQ